jgi:hypothetical protein
LLEDDDLPDFPSECWFFPCRCRAADIAALQGREEELCRENAELRTELDAKEALIAERRAEVEAARR